MTFLRWLTKRLECRATVASFALDSDSLTFCRALTPQQWSGLIAWTNTRVYYSLLLHQQPTTPKAYSMTAAVKKRGRGFGFTPLSGGLKALTSSEAKQAKQHAPPTQAPEMQKASSSDRPQVTALQEPQPKEARPRDELSGKLILEVIDGKQLPLSAKSNPYILCNFDASFSSTGSPVSPVGKAVFWALTNFKSSYAPGVSFCELRSSLCHS